MPDVTVPSPVKLDAVTFDESVVPVSPDAATLVAVDADPADVAYVALATAVVPIPATI